MTDTAPPRAGDTDIRIRPVTDADVPAVVALWRAAGLVVPWNDPHADIALCRSKPHNAALLVGLSEDTVAATVMIGHDGHRGWLYYLAVAPDRQRCGFGRRMVAAAEAWLAGHGLPKAQLLVRDTNQAVLAFYERLGYGRSPTVVMQKWLQGSR